MMKNLMMYFWRAVGAFDKFFFEFSAPLSVAGFRIMFGTTLLINVVLRMMHTEYYFTDAGGISAADAATLLPDFFRPAFYWMPTSLAAAWIMQSVMAAALVAFTLGIFGRIGTRITSLVILFCHLGLLQRNFSIVYGADMVSSFWCFGFCFVDSTERLSLRSRWQNRKDSWRTVEPDWSRILTSMGVRLMQIQLCVIYMYTGFEKLKGGDWWDQTAVWKVLGNEQLMLADLSFLRAVPLVIGLATWGTVLFEVYCPLLFWGKKTSRWTILAGWSLHIGIALTMGLFIFSLTMMSAYWLFLEPQIIQNGLAKFSHRRLRTAV
ncbi:hypothetical protein BH10BDE1_BH10BDE1_12540 [soil metagenome]